MSQISPLAIASAADSNTAANNIAARQTDGDFAQAFNEALTQTLMENAISETSGSAALPYGSSLGDLQSSLLAGAVSGQTGSHDMLVYMMMMMMQEFSNSDPTPMMAALAALNPASSSSAFSVSGSSGTMVDLRPSKLSWQGAPASSGFLPAQAWLPTSLRITGNAANRNAAGLRQVIDQFNVESADRYRPYKNGNTYCNIFVWDVTRALGCEIPHYVDRITSEPRTYPNTNGAYELDANGTHDWLVKHGENYGWREVSAEEAQSYANAGYPAVTAWKNNDGGAGHVQVVCPSQNGAYDAARGVTVAQAGSRNFSYAHLNATMSKDKIAGVRYFIHA